jgi:WD40 repeat protein
LWDLETRATVWRFDYDPNALYRGDLAFRPDGRILALTTQEEGASGTIRLFDVATGQQTRSWPVPLPEAGSFHSSLAFSPDGKTLAVSANDTVFLWDAATGQRLNASGDLHVRRLVFSPDGRRLALVRSNSYGSPWVVILLDTSNWKETSRFQGTSGRLIDVAFDPDGQTLYSWTFWPSERRAWDVATGISGPPVVDGGGFGRPFPSLPPGCRPFLFSPDGAMVLTTSTQEIDVGWKGFHDLTLWETASGAERFRFPDQSGPLAVAFSPDGRLLAVGTLTGGVRLWDVFDISVLARRDSHHGAVTALAFSPDGKYLVSGGWDTTVLVWDLAALLPMLSPEAPLSEERLNDVWEALSGDNAVRAYQAMGALALRPEQAVPWLRDRLIRQKDPNRLRQARIIETLERIGTPEARKLLETMTEPEAKAALDRLKRRLP